MFTRWSDFDRTFSAMDELRRRMERAFHEVESGRDPYTGVTSFHGDEAWGGFPRTTVADEGNALVLRAEVPGLGEKDVNVSVHNQTLTLSGERKVVAPEGYAAFRRERAPVKFQRSFTLPSRVDAERTQAKLENGILTVTLPKPPESQPRQISIKAS